MQTKAAIRDVGRYMDNMAWPEDADSPEITQGDLEGFLYSVDYYADNMDTLEDVLEDFEQKLAEFEQTRAVAVQNKSGTDTNQAKGE